MTGRERLPHAHIAVDPDVWTLLEAAPGFGGRYLELVTTADGDPGAAVSFTELADYVVDLAMKILRLCVSLEGCMNGLEKVALGSPDAEELVVWSFLDSLSPDGLRLLGPWFLPRPRSLLEKAERAPRRSGGAR